MLIASSDRYGWRPHDPCRPNLNLLDELLEQLESKPGIEPVGELSQELVDALLHDDDGCCDLECWRCYSPLSPSHLRTLAQNLASAGMLCRAWQQRDQDSTWRPGCQIR